MTLAQILFLTGVALLSMAVLPARWRGWWVFGLSVVVIFWLQPTLNIPWLDFSLPALTLALTVLLWALTLPATERRLQHDDKVALGIIVAVILLLSLPRYIAIPEELQLTSRPPEITSVLLGLIFAGGVLWWVLREQITGRAQIIAPLLLIGLFIVLATEPLSILLSQVLRGLAGRDPALAQAVDIQWLGYSYVAFRLLHTLRDRQLNTLPMLRLHEYVTYVIFFPAYTAGPIDRIERFQADFSALPTLQRRDDERIQAGLLRIVFGMVKKFALADTLALFALNEMNAQQAVSPLALWVLLYAYALRLYWDFSGYTDIAIGIGQLLGFRLPPNFDRPYLKQNIAAFWQSWHMTLSQWVRAYVYSPLSRSLLRRKWAMNNVVILCTVVTMVIIGLWHGVTLPFLIWGLWHSVALVVHKLWSDRTRKWYLGLKQTPRRLQLWTIAGIFITFHVVCLGWVWFALPDAALALNVLGRLFGLGW